MADADVLAVLRPNYPNSTLIQLRASVVHVGRASFGEGDVQLAPDDAQASRLHAILYLRDDRWHLEDVSRNGTWVNNNIVSTRSVELMGGDSIKIGSSFHYTFWDLRDTAENEMGGGMNATQSSDSIPAPRSARPSQPRQGVWINTRGNVVRDAQELSITLSPTEYKLLEFLLTKPSQVVDYTTLSKAVWGDNRNASHVHELIFRLRRKVEVDPSKPHYLIIRPKLGVVFYPKGEPA